MSETVPSERPSNARAMTYAEIETAYREKSPLLKLLRRRPQSLLAINAIELWVLALIALVFVLAFRQYGWDKSSSLGRPRFEVHVTIPPAPESLDEQDIEVMNTGVIDLGGAVYGIANLLSLLGLLLAAVALLVPKRRRRLAVVALTLNFLLLYCMTVMVP